MPLKPRPTAETPNTLSVRFGRWFEASGTGHGVIVIPILVALLVAGAVLSRLLA